MTRDRIGALQDRILELESLCLDARYFVKNFTCQYQEEEALRANFLKAFPFERSAFPHMDTCGLKNGGSKCTCGLLTASETEEMQMHTLAVEAIIRSVQKRVA